VIENSYLNLKIGFVLVNDIHIIEGAIEERKNIQQSHTVTTRRKETHYLL
jgi:hypothetical protein